MLRNGLDDHLGSGIWGTTDVVKKREDRHSDSEENFEKFFSEPFPPPLPTERIKKSRDFIEITDEVERSRFAILGRVMLICGLVLLYCCMSYSCMVEQPPRGSGAFAIEAAQVFNMPRAMTKLAAILIGVTLTLSGVILWTGSNTAPSIPELIGALIGLGGLVVIVLLTLLS